MTIFSDTAGVRRFDLLEQAVRRAGAHKMLFGSDGPWLHPGVELTKVRALKLSAAQERLVLGQNFLRLTARVRKQFGRINFPTGHWRVASAMHDR